MPELPEVEIICRGLREAILENIIVDVQNLTNLKLRQEIPINFAQKIIHSKIVDIQRRAKYIKIFLSNDFIILIHLGMSGKLLIKNKEYSYQKHDHLVIKCNNKQLIFNDPRRFGLINLVKTNEIATHHLIKNLGIEPFDKNFTIDYLARMLNKKQLIKLSLMDNTKLVGVGNIYASEVLFLSEISPKRTSNSLTEEEIISLYKNIIQVLNDSIKRGGSSLKDYTSVSGENGYFQKYFNVYGREGEDCKNCGKKIVKIKQAGRGSFYCVHCQK